MAIIIEGKSKCPICENIITKGDSIIMFPPFTGNSKDDLFIFSDSGFHESCFNIHQLKDKVLHMANQSIKGIKLSDKKCMISGEVILSFEDEEVISMITSKEDEELYNYNFFRFNKTKIVQWEEREKLLLLLQKFKDEGKWSHIGDFDYLNYLIKLLRQ